MTNGTATLDDLPVEKSSAASRPSHHEVAFSSLRMGETRTNLGSELK